MPPPWEHSLGSDTPMLASKTRASDSVPAFTPGPSTLWYQPYVRNGRNRRSVHRLRPRAQQCGSYNVDRLAPVRGSRIRSYRMCDACHQRSLQRTCHIGFHKLRMYPYTVFRTSPGLRGCSLQLVEITRDLFSAFQGLGEKGWLRPRLDDEQDGTRC